MSEEFEYEGLRFSVKTEIDTDLGAPWEEYDGHGPVSDWTRRAKTPGELVICEYRGSKRYYDFAEAVRIAKKDGWDAEPYGEGAAGQRAARAAKADFEYLRGWCNGQWWYVGVVVTLLDDYGDETDIQESVGGVESFEESVMDVARELASQIIATHKTMAELAYETQ